MSDRIVVGNLVAAIHATGRIEVYRRNSADWIALHTQSDLDDLTVLLDALHERAKLEKEGAQR